MTNLADTGRLNRYRDFHEWEAQMGKPRAEARLRTLSMAQAASNLFMAAGKEGIDFIPEFGTAAAPLAKGHTVELGSPSMMADRRLYRRNALRKLVLEPVTGKLVTVDLNRSHHALREDRFIAAGWQGPLYIPGSRKEVGEYTYRLGALDTTPYPVRGLEPVTEDEALRREQDIQSLIIRLARLHRIDSAPLEEIFATTAETGERQAL